MLFLVLLRLAGFIFTILSLTAATDTYSLSFQRSGEMVPDEFAKYQGYLPSMANFTICSWVKFHFEREIMTIWSYCWVPNKETSEQEFICSQLNFEPAGYLNWIFFDQLHSAKIKKKMWSQTWSFVCGTFRKTGDGSVGRLYFNGILVSEFITELERNLFVGGGALTLAQQQRDVGGGQNPLTGLVSGFNIWNFVMGESQIKDLANCRVSSSGNVLNWKTSKWVLNGVVENETLSKEDFCEKFPSKRYVLFSQRRSMSSAHQLCIKMGGKLAVPLNATENSLLTKIALVADKSCEDFQNGKTVWIGIYRKNEDDWKDLTSNETVKYFNWEKISISSGNNNCAFLLAEKTTSRSVKKEADDGRWIPGITSAQTPRLACTVCEFSSQERQIFRLQGLCKESRYDRLYMLVNDNIKMDRPYFKGISSSVIYWNKTDSSWHLHHLLFQYEATLGDYTMDKYPTGRQLWTLFDHNCGDPKGRQVNLTLTYCSQSEFTCNDGTCVPMHSRCDLVWHCKDRSDEEGCKKIVFPADYESALAPKTFSATSSTEPLTVFLSLDILSFDKVDNLNMMFSVMVRLNLTWRDRRLNFMNLRQDFYQNLINSEEKQKLWMPTVGFFNAKTGPFAKEDHYTLTIRRDSEPAPYDDSQPTEDERYKGQENSLMFLRRFYAEYHCTFNLRFFPFDKQTCLMVFKLRTANKNVVALKPGNLLYRGPLSLVEFSISNITMIEGSKESTRSSIKVSITFERDYIYHLTQSFLQSFLMSLLAYFTFWISMSDFQDRFMGSMTALLVLVSQTVSINSTLPKTSYFKMIDMWLQFYLMSTASIVIAHILLDRWYRYELKIKEKYKIINNSASDLFHEQDGVPLSNAIGLEMAPMSENSLFQSEEKKLEENPPRALIGKTSLKSNVSLNSFVTKQTSSIQKKVKKFTSNAESFNNMLRFLFCIIFIIFISTFFLMAKFKFGDVNLHHQDIDSWNQLTNDTIVIK